MTSLISFFHFRPDEEESHSGSLTSTSFYFGFDYDNIPHNQGPQLPVSDDEESEEGSGPATAENQPNHEAEDNVSTVAVDGDGESRNTEIEDIQENGQRRPVLRFFYRALFGLLYVTALVLRFLKDLFHAGYEKVLQWIGHTDHMRMQLDDLA